jgi:N4-(beta-N-acetylglucosaminyl)-L-asparaginase
MNQSSRRTFIRTLAASPGISVVDIPFAKNLQLPIFLSTWDFGIEANKKAYEVYNQSKHLISALEAGVQIPEADISNQSVGLGGLPDREGIVTLDACIMNHEGKAGAVAALEKIMHPISVARRVMEKTPHVFLVGAGALQFAREQGFEETNLLSPKSKKDWEEWKKTSLYKPVINIENHDTIGMIGMDTGRNLSGACTTSGLAYKMHGRVGDSPIIGAGLYIDNEVGAATGTGLGEKVLTQCSSFLIVELMRQGLSPQQACIQAIRRIVKKNRDYKEFQVGLLAMNKKGQIGAYSIQPGFSFALSTGNKHAVYPASSYIPK